eukprot:TRINITY_DN675_c0_g2_i1.p1 TRINITY_DN675_c0_g2~~TRINITY_DN675_c0_g2_i1.p1  ORF type:complete len:469 (+),score=47.60 TRINITY_DN675_c0_g2_i1:59-1465(+)
MMQCASIPILILIVLSYVAAAAPTSVDASRPSRDAVGDGPEQERRASVERDLEAEMMAVDAEVMALDGGVMALEAEGLGTGDQSFHRNDDPHNKHKHHREDHHREDHHHRDHHRTGWLGFSTHPHTMEWFTCPVSQSASSDSRAGGDAGYEGEDEGGTRVLDLAAPRIIISKYCSISTNIDKTLSRLVSALCIPKSGICQFETVSGRHRDRTLLDLGLHPPRKDASVVIAACAQYSIEHKVMMLWKDGNLVQVSPSIKQTREKQSAASAYLRAGAKFFISWRASVLDRFLCAARDCFLNRVKEVPQANTIAYSVAPGSDARLRDDECFERRKNNDTHAHAIYVRSPEKMAAVLDVWLQRPEEWKGTLPRLGVNASSVRVVTSESLVLFESDPYLLDAAVTEWHNVLSSLDIYADVRDVRAFLAPMAGTREPPKSFAEQIRNWDEVETYLKTQRPDLYDVVMRRGRSAG